MEPKPRRVGGSNGLDLHLLEWSEGRFEFCLADVAEEDEINLSTADAIMQLALEEDDPPPETLQE